MEIPPRISKKRLFDFSGEHLYYEISMLEGSIHALLDGPENQCVYNALLESFVMHTSIILDFFYKPQIKSDDARAIHYVKDRKAWFAKLPSFDKHFQRFVNKRNKRVVHLSYKRLDISDQERQWKAKEILRDIRKIVDLFLEYADPELIHPRLYELSQKKGKSS